MNNRIVIVKLDGVVVVDGVGQSGLDLSFLASNIAVVQWYNTYGTVEYSDSTPTLAITDFTPYMQAYNNWYTAYQANTNRPDTYYLKSNWRESRRYKLNETPNLTLYTTLTPLENEEYQIFSEGIWQVDLPAKTEAERVAFNNGIQSQITVLELQFQQQYVREIILGIDITANTTALTDINNQIIALKEQIIPPPEGG
jgi:hypothetical protein